jgi:chromosome segregation ATPase
MKHGDKTLNSVIDTLNENISDLNDEKQKIDEQLVELNKKLDKNASTLEIINNTLTVHEKLISDLQTDNANNKTFIAELQKLLFGIQETLSNITNDMAELKANAITTINGTDNEIKVEIRNNEDKIGHKAIIGFADDAYFVAGD